MEQSESKEDIYKRAKNSTRYPLTEGFRMLMKVLPNGRRRDGGVIFKEEKLY